MQYVPTLFKKGTCQVNNKTSDVKTAINMNGAFTRVIYYNNQNTIITQITVQQLFKQDSSSMDPGHAFRLFMEVVCKGHFSGPLTMQRQGRPIQLIFYLNVFCWQCKMIFYPILQGATQTLFRTALTSLRNLNIQVFERFT